MTVRKTIHLAFSLWRIGHYYNHISGRESPTTKKGVFFAHNIIRSNLFQITAFKVIIMAPDEDRRKMHFQLWLFYTSHGRDSKKEGLQFSLSSNMLYLLFSIYLKEFWVWVKVCKTNHFL